MNPRQREIARNLPRERRRFLLKQQEILPTIRTSPPHHVVPECDRRTADGHSQAIPRPQQAFHSAGPWRQWREWERGGSRRIGRARRRGGRSRRVRDLLVHRVGYAQ